MRDKERKRVLKKRARILFAQFREVLLRDWDPLGFHVPEDEYDEYVARTLAMALRGVSAEGIGRYLLEVGIGIGLDETRNPAALCATVAQKLIALVDT